MTTPADTLTTEQMAGVVDAANPSVGLSFDAYDATSDDETIATIGVGSSNTILVIAHSAGNVNVPITRHSDSQVSIIPVTVTAIAPGVFVAHLGTAVAKP